MKNTPPKDKILKSNRESIRVSHIPTHISFSNQKNTFYSKSFTLVDEPEKINIISEFLNQQDNIMSVHGKSTPNTRPTSQKRFKISRKNQ